MNGTTLRTYGRQLLRRVNSYTLWAFNPQPEPTSRTTAAERARRAAPSGGPSRRCDRLRGAAMLTRMEYVESLLDLVGNTPLVRLTGPSTCPTDAAGAAPLVLAKVEYLNPGGSVKDRIAARMIDAAEASGELQPGGTIVEPTSGNTGVGLAMVAQAKGYRCVFVCPDKVSEDKRNVLKAYGAEVVVCPTAVAPEHPDSYYNVSDRLVEGARRLEARPVLQPEQPALALRDDRPRDLAADRGADHPLRVRHGHRRHDQRRRPLPQGAQCRTRRPGPGDRRRPGRLGVLRRHRPARTWSRASARTSGPRPTTATSPTGSSRSPTPTRSRSPAGWPARRRCSSAAPPGWRRTPPVRSPASWPGRPRATTP